MRFNGLFISVYVVYESDLLLVVYVNGEFINVGGEFIKDMLRNNVII